MPNYRLVLAYDGSGFRGYAKQSGQRTVQGELEKVLKRVLGSPVTTYVAGRTDAGVHARGQVVSFQAPEAETKSLQRSLNSMLGEEIAIRDLVVVSDEFNARFSATRRVYRYRASVASVPDPLQRKYVWHLPERIEFDLLNATAEHFVGQIDFTSFCRSVDGNSNVRRVGRSEWERRGESDLEYWVEANAFCQQMVRSLVGICYDVGRSHISLDDIPGIIAQADRTNMGNTVAPPHGLTLWEVGYPV